jgi:hypothetical protein
LAGLLATSLAYGTLASDTVPPHQDEPRALALEAKVAYWRKHLRWQAVGAGKIVRQCRGKVTISQPAGPVAEDHLANQAIERIRGR